MSEITDQGKKYANVKFLERCDKNKDIVRKNNDDLPAGSPMYYYCKGCGEEMKLPETHPGPAPQHCEECKELKKLCWLC
jgi:DNA replicative helicase MCM subunit Mcm2 (Cdc46/Mcm family)